MRGDRRSLNAKTDNKRQLGSHKNHKDPHFGYSPTDIYYKVEKRLPDSKVSIPTYDAVVEAKDWVDNINKK